VGTGGGAIAVTLAAHLPDAVVWAVDISADALAVARQNAAWYDLLDRMAFAQGDLLGPFLEQGQQADLIVANLPYVASRELESLAVARYEPHLALDGGADGLELIRRLLVQAPDTLAAGGLLLLEIGAKQGARVCEMAESAFPGAQVWVLADYAGHERVVCVERGG
jgi:release factor glutamine methyltransferase